MWCSTMEPSRKESVTVIPRSVKAGHFCHLLRPWIPLVYGLSGLQSSEFFLTWNEMEDVIRMLRQVGVHALNCSVLELSRDFMK